ncbi:MAG: AbrB/MazE/SpoVT family DNA-binding domain-containing protein [Acidobacteriota bacterium]
MKTTIDKAGRLVVPKSIRKAAQLEPGTEVEVRVVERRVEIEPVPMEVSLERRGKLLVAVPRRARTKLKKEEVQATIDDVRKGRKGR